MYVEDLAQVLQTNLATTEKKYPHGRYRIQAQLYLQLGGFTANRPKSLLNLCYRHIQVAMLRDPEGGPHRVLLEFTFEFTKQFLGIKDMYVGRYSVIHTMYLLTFLQGIPSHFLRLFATRRLSSVRTSFSLDYFSMTARLQPIT
jgi:hypothetical protein